MAAGDAKPVPIKDTAYRVTFPILDADGDLVAGATSLDTEFSEDAAAFADATNEATQIATSSGMYYLDVTSGEMGGDTVAFIVKSAEGKTTPIVLYPQSAANPINVNVQAISTDSTAADNLELFFDGTGYNASNSAIGTVATATAVTTVNGLAANVITAAATAADFGTEVRSIVSGTSDSGTTTTMVDAARTEADTDYWKGCLIYFTSGTISGQVRLITGFTPASDTITFSPATTQTVGTQTYEILPAGTVRLFEGTHTSAVVPSVTTVTGNVDGNVGGNVTGSVGSLAAQAKTDVNAEVVDALATDTYAESASVPAATASLAAKIQWLATLARNKITQTSTTQTLRNDADSGNIATSTVSDDATTATRGEWT